SPECHGRDLLSATGWRTGRSALHVYCGLTHRARLHVPDLRGILRNRSVTRELPGMGDVEDGLSRPFFRVRVQSANLGVRLAVCREVGQVHVVVTAGEQRVPDGGEDAGLMTAEVVGTNEVQGAARLGLVVVVPARIVPAARLGNLQGVEAEQEE